LESNNNDGTDARDQNGYELRRRRSAGPAISSLVFCKIFKAKELAVDLRFLALVMAKLLEIKENGLGTGVCPRPFTFVFSSISIIQDWR
jgi:hypothetical protein